MVTDDLKRLTRIEPSLTVRRVYSDAIAEVERLQGERDGIELELIRMAEKNEDLRMTLRGISEYCSGEHQVLGAVGRLIAIRNTAEQALRAHEQSTRPQAKAGTCDGSCNEEGGPGCQC